MVFTRFRRWDKPHSDKLHFQGEAVCPPPIPIARFLPELL